MTRSTMALMAGMMGALIAGCGSSSGGGGGGTTTTQGTGSTITIHNMTFSPAQLTVAPGTVVTVVNQDGATPHSVTSEAAAGDYTPGAVSGVQFDTGVFTGQRTFTVPMNAPAGTVIPFYCAVHKAGMTPPNGSIVVQAAGGTTGTSGTSGTSGTTGTGAAPAAPAGGGY